MKKIISAILVVCLVAMCVPVAYAHPIEDDKVFICSYSAFNSEADCRDFKAQIADELAKEGIISSVYFPGDPMPINDVNDYKTVVVAQGVARASGYAANQPPNGVKFEAGTTGYIYYSRLAGTEVTVSVTLRNLEGTISGTVQVKLPLGRQTPTLDTSTDGSGVCGYMVPIAGGAYRKLWVVKNYNVVEYVTYKWGWVNDMVGYDWQEFSGGRSQQFDSIEFYQKTAPF